MVYLLAAGSVNRLTARRIARFADVENIADSGFSGCKVLDCGFTLFFIHFFTLGFADLVNICCVSLD